ncbi:MAG: hypothetical protein IPF50_12120, partial [Proteobacteria bacterium]|nr:hypothetical protein [Pseudomonadota bacterium]
AIVPLLLAFRRVASGVARRLEHAPLVLQLQMLEHFLYVLEVLLQAHLRPRDGFDFLWSDFW